MDEHIALIGAGGLQAIVTIALVVLHFRLREKVNRLELDLDLTQDNADNNMRTFRDFRDRIIATVDKKTESIEPLAQEVNQLRERVLAQPGPSRHDPEFTPRISWRGFKKLASENVIRQMEGRPQ